MIALDCAFRGGSRLLLADGQTIAHLVWALRGPALSIGEASSGVWVRNAIWICPDEMRFEPR